MSAVATARARERYRPPADARVLQATDFLEESSPALILKAPACLYTAGNAQLLHGTKRVAVVGSRKASAEGIRRARKLARGLAQAGVVVVSGLAAGIDTAAHEGAIAAGGRTIAVIGTPLDRVYPAENARLQEHIAEEHLLLSQFAPGARISGRNFIARNRTVALLTHASVIVEAGDTSGSLSQAAETQRFGRPVFFMRSVLEHPELTWPARFRAYEANPARVLDRVEQVLETLGL